MPKDKHFKRRVRERMAQTGERYTTARARLRPDAVDAGGGLPDDVAHLARSPRRWPELVEPQERLVADLQRRHGNEHPDTIQARFSLAEYYRSAGRIDDQLRQFEQAAADTARLHTPEDVQSLATADGLVAAYVRAGRWDGATAAAGRILADRERVLGADHPRTVDVRNRAALYAQVRDSDLAQVRSGQERGSPLDTGRARARYAAARAAPDTTPERRPDELAYLHAIVGRDVETVMLTADTALHQRLAVDFILLAWRLAERPAHHRRVDPTNMDDPAAYRAAAGDRPHRRIQVEGPVWADGATDLAYSRPGYTGEPDDDTNEDDREMILIDRVDLLVAAELLQRWGERT